MKSGSNLERVLASGEFAVTCELGPPLGADADSVRRKMELLRGCADAYNVTDCQTAVSRLSSIAASALLVQGGLDPVMQMTTRDRNRIAIQSDILGAAALGIRNCLCIAGDHQSFSAAGRMAGHPGARNVYDVDSVQLVAILRRMRDEGVFESGDAIETPPRLLIGAAWTPMADPVDFRVVRLAKKIAAGADFIQTQGVYDVAQFAAIMEEVRCRGLHEKTAILPGVIVPKSAAMLRYMASSVAGVRVPEELIRRFPVVRKSDDPRRRGELRAESGRIGTQVAVELIEQLRGIDGVRGVHIQSIEWEEAVPGICAAAGLLPRPQGPPADC